MDNLPPELITLILLPLGVKDALSLSAVSWTLRHVVTSCDQYWREECLTAVGQSSQPLMSVAKNEWDMFVSFCRQITEVKRWFAVDYEVLAVRAELELQLEGFLDLHQGVVRVETTPLAGRSCLVRVVPSSSEGSHTSSVYYKSSAICYKMACYRNTSEGAIHMSWSLGDAKKFVLFATNPLAPFLVVLTRVSRGVKLKWLNVTSGATLWQSELDKLPRMKHANETVLHFDKYPAHSELCPHCGAVITLRSRSPINGRGIAIVYVPERGAHQLVPHTFTCHIVESDHCIPPLHHCLVFLVRTGHPVSRDVGTHPPRPCKEHGLVTFTSNVFGEYSMLRSAIRYDAGAKRFQYSVLCETRHPISVTLDTVGIAASPLHLVTLDAVVSEDLNHAHLQASVLDIETTGGVRRITLEYEFSNDISQYLAIPLKDSPVSVHLCTACFLVVSVRDHLIDSIKYLCFSLATGRCIGQLDLPGCDHREVIVMNRALLDSFVHVSEEDLYELPLLAVLHCVPQQSHSSSMTRNSKCLLM